MCPSLQIIAFISSLFLMSCTNAVSQEYENAGFGLITTENKKIEKGLSQNSVYSIFQDKDGFLWFGTWDGLNRYDGINFRIFNQENGLSNQTIYSILQDTTGLIWIGTESGLNIYNPVNGKIKTFYHQTEDSTSLSDNWINQIYLDRNRNIWIATARGLSKYNRADDNFINFLDSPRDNSAFKSNQINCIIQDSLNNYWLGTQMGLIRLNINNKIIERYYHKNGDEHSLPGNIINSMLIDKFGNLWIGSNSGLCQYNYENQNFQNFEKKTKLSGKLTASSITTLLKGVNNNIWIGTDGNGLYYYNTEMDTLRHFKHLPSNQNSIANNRVFSLFIDQSSTVWIGTFNGINKYDRNSSYFPVFRADNINENGLNNEFVRAFYEKSPGIIWIGTEKGINILNEKTGMFTYIVKKEGGKNTLSSNNIRDIYRDSNGIFWIGTADSGLNTYNPETAKFESFKFNRNKNSIPGNFILNIQEDNNGFIWISTGRGLSKFNPGNKLFTNYLFNPDDSSTYGFRRIYKIHKDNNGDLWFASQNGLIKYIEEDDSFKPVNIYPEGHTSEKATQLFTIYEDSLKNFWIGTRGSGLVKYNVITGKSKIYTEQDGLPNHVVYGILQDNKGYLWISTNWGLSKFNPDTENFINYDVRDGLQSNEFNSNGVLKSSSGKMYFGGMKGFNCFYPENIKINKNIPPVRITDFLVYNVPVPDSILASDTILLNYDQNFFTIKFAALDYTNPLKNKYRYILEDFEKQWRSTNADNPEANYTRVNPGTYIFNVTGSNNDGIWNSKGARKVIIINPPWYQHWLFRIPFSLLLIIVAWLLIRSRIRGIKKQHKVEKKVLAIEKQMFEIEQKALQLQMNPHFIFNSLNSIQSFVLKNDTDKAINYLAKFSQLMRFILSNSREAYIPVKNEVEAVKHYLDIEKLRFDDKFDYQINIDHSIDQEFTEIPPMIIQPYIENAIIHGLVNSEKKGKIEIQIKRAGNSILCIVEDNGIGREKAEIIKNNSGIKRKSRGMIITKERLDILSRQHKEKFNVTILDLKDSSGKPTGTRVEIIMHFIES